MPRSSGRDPSSFSDPLDRVMLALFLLTLLVTVGFAWLLRAVPVPSASCCGSDRSALAAGAARGARTR
jgi:hypothetical protein